MMSAVFDMTVIGYWHKGVSCCVCYYLYILYTSVFSLDIEGLSVYTIYSKG